MSGRGLAAAALAACTLAVGGGALAAPPPPAPEDRVLTPAEHSSEKARVLATRHAAALRDLNREIYFCLPWLETQQKSIGFFKPRHVQDDLRYLSLRVFVEQQPSREFASLTSQERATSMVSRYGGPLLRLMTRNPGIMNDDAIDGFSLLIEWRKPAASSGGRPIHETIAMFIEKVDADEYIGNRMTMRDLSTRSRILGWDGDRLIGTLNVIAWDDDFIKSHTMKNYEPPPGMTCH